MMNKKQAGGTDLLTAPLIFGGNIFGWTVDESMGWYTMFKKTGVEMALAGMMGMTPEMGPMPPSWTPL